MTEENTMSPDSEVKDALRCLRLPVLDTLQQKQLQDLAVHLRRLADYMDARVWAISADRIRAPTQPAP